MRKPYKNPGDTQVVIKSLALLALLALCALRGDVLYERTHEISAL